MFESMMKTKKTLETKLKQKVPTARAGPDPRYVEAMNTISKMETEKRMMEEKMERMEKRMQHLEQCLEQEAKKQSHMEEAIEEYGLRDSVMERAEEIARAFRSQ
jgi:hypothetical protein